MPKLTIDGQEIEIEEGHTILQACKMAGVEIPHFCFHERLNIAGNCRMCLVETDKSPKPVASCAMAAQEGMVINTKSPKVQKAREGVMEFLLINHPLDCPICDQGGECDLQDQAFAYGRSTPSRFSENKRAIKDKYMGPLVKTNMTRCIHCTRCVRFATEVAGVEEIGTIGRGEHMEITSYLDKALTSELSGNIIDLCPVGALTSKPYAFKARSWELESTESIDVLDAVGSNIRVDSRGLEVMRVLPKLHEDINEEWLSDKARFSYDALKYQRLDRSYVRKSGKLQEATWEEAINLVVRNLRALKGSEIAAVAGTLACAESMFMLKKLFNSIGCENLDANQFGYKIDTSSRANYLFNTTIAGIERADFCIMVGANPRQVAPVLNARIGKMVRQGALKVARIGEEDNQTYKIQELGQDPVILEEILSGKHSVSKKLANAKNPMIIIGDGAYSREDGYALIALASKIAEKYQLVRNDWNGFNVLHNHASMVGAIDLGFISSDNILGKVANREIKFVYLLGADEIDMSLLKSAFVVYQGHHGDVGASNADVVFPAAAYTEQDAIYVNLEGRAQLARGAVPPPGIAKPDWMIISELARSLEVDLPSSLKEIRQEMSKLSPSFNDIGNVTASEFKPINSKDKLLLDPITKVAINYYMTDVISKTSLTMLKCSKEREKEIA